MYQVLGMCRLAGPAYELVLYQALHNDPEFGDKALWVRPVEEFLSKVVVNGEEMDRFKFLG